MVYAFPARSDLIAKSVISFSSKNKAILLLRYASPVPGSTILFIPSVTFANRSAPSSETNIWNINSYTPLTARTLATHVAVSCMHTDLISSLVNTSATNTTELFVIFVNSNSMFSSSNVSFILTKLFPIVIFPFSSLTGYSLSPSFKTPSLFSSSASLGILPSNIPCFAKRSSTSFIDPPAISICAYWLPLTSVTF